MRFFNSNSRSVKSPDTYDPAEFDENENEEFDNDNDIPPPPPPETEGFVDTPLDDNDDQNTLPYPEANNLQQQQQGSYANLTGAFRGQEKAQTFDEEEAGMDEIEVPSSSVVDRWNTWEEKYALKKRCRMLFIVGLGAVLVILAVTLGSVFGIRGSNKGGVAPNEADGGTVGTDETGKDTTTTTTAGDGTGAGTDTSSTGTGTGNNDEKDSSGIPDHMNTLAGKALWDNDQLPATTKADFENPESAASKAYKWLESDTTIASMEEGDQLDLYVNQRFAAATLYNSFVDDDGQPMIKEWMTDDDVCEWKGIICGNPTARARKLQDEDQDSTVDTDTASVATDPLADYKITILDLSKLGMKGSIAPEIALLKDLTRIQMYDNKITGPIPEEIYSMTKLVVLDLYNNQLSGTISPSIGNLNDLMAIYLGQNKFTGDIPVEIYGFTDLFSLWIDYLDGVNGNPLPAEVGQLVNLEELIITKSNFNGQLPAEINGLVKLEKLMLSENAFTGAIPALDQLVNLETLDLSENFFSGDLPRLRNHAALLHLRLNGNGLQGFIPNHYGRLEKLVELRLNGNVDDDIEGSGLTNTIPESLGSLENLKHLALQYNKLTGEIPDTIGALVNLEQFFVNRNRLTGDVPDEVCELTESNVLETMEADCLIGCDCCTNEEECARE